MTHRSAGIHPVREPNKINDSSTTSTRNNNGARRDSIAQSEGDVPKKTGSTRTDGVADASGLSRSNSLARRDSVIQRRGSMIRRDNQALMETNDGDGRESVTQDSGMTDLTEATQYEQGRLLMKTKIYNNIVCNYFIKKKEEERKKKKSSVVVCKATGSYIL